MYKIEVRNLDGQIIVDTTTHNREWAAHLFYQWDAMGHIVTVFDQNEHGRVCLAN